MQPTSPHRSAPAAGSRQPPIRHRSLSRPRSNRSGSTQRGAAGHEALASQSDFRPSATAAASTSISIEAYPAPPADLAQAAPPLPLPPTAAPAASPPPLTTGASWVWAAGLLLAARLGRAGAEEARLDPRQLQRQRQRSRALSRELLAARERWRAAEEARALAEDARRVEEVAARAREEARRRAQEQRQYAEAAAREAERMRAEQGVKRRAYEEEQVGWEWGGGGVRGRHAQRIGWGGATTRVGGRCVGARALQRRQATVSFCPRRAMLQAWVDWMPSTCLSHLPPTCLSHSTAAQ